MLPEIGQITLIAALGLAIFQSVIPFIGIKNNLVKLIYLSQKLAIWQFIFLLLAFLILTTSFIQNDFSVKYVAINSNSLLPLFYRIGAVWGGHEGSLLLWVLMIAFWGALLALNNIKQNTNLHAMALSIMAMIGVGFLVFTIFTSNPFERIYPPLADGNDLNPLLQDPGLIFHPPLLYMGYVGFAVAFAYSTAALIEARTDTTWMKIVRPWTNIAWMFLTLGIVLGSWWAYNELGWGGWWFWDPVENASFMPWLAGTALIHSITVSIKRDLFKTWTILLAVLTFSLSLLGTFLVRSGILSSVHAFASDPTRGLFILLLLAIVIGSSLFLYSLRAPKLIANNNFVFTSRETCLLINTVFMVSAVFTVLLGTIYPLILEAITNDKISVGPPYFNFVFIILMFPALIIISFAMTSKWHQDNIWRIIKTISPLIIFSIIVGLLLPYLFFNSLSISAATASILAFWILSSSFYIFILDYRSTSNKKAIIKTKLGMTVAHIGIAIFIIGVSFTSIYGIEEDVRLEQDEIITVGDYEINFTKFQDQNGPNYYAQITELEFTSKDGQSFILRPEKRHYYSQESPLTEAAIYITFFKDIYVSLGERRQDYSWSARIQIKPFVRWIWAGAVIMALGGLISAIFNRKIVLQK